MTLLKSGSYRYSLQRTKTGFTANNVAVSSFVMNIGTQDEILIRVISKRQALEEVVSNLSKNQKYLLKADYNAVSARWMTVLRKKYTKLKLLLSN